MLEMTYQSDILDSGLPAILNDPMDLSILASYQAMQVEGEPDLIVELIDLYLDDVPRRIEALGDAVAQRSWTALAAEAHGLRGSSGSLGAQQVAQICLEIESLKSNDDWSNIPSLLSWLELECERALHILMEERRGRLR